MKKMKENDLNRFANMLYGAFVGGMLYALAISASKNTAADALRTQYTLDGRRDLAEKVDQCMNEQENRSTHVLCAILATGIGAVAAGIYTSNPSQKE